MKRITLLIILFLITHLSLHAQLYTLPGCAQTGANTFGPMYSTSISNSTNRTAVIYPASQLATISGEVLTGLYFNRFSGGLAMTGTPTFKIYIKETTATDFGVNPLDWSTAITDATLVYDSNPITIVGTTTGWKLFPMLSNFAYSGTQNLAVFFEYINTSTSSAFQWSTESLSPCVDNTNSNTTKYLNGTIGLLPASLTMSDFKRPYIGFDFIESCVAPISASATNLTSNSATIDWVTSTTLPSNGFEYYLSDSNLPPLPSTVATGAVSTGNSVFLNTLTPNTNYIFWVRSVCDSGDKSVWKASPTFKTSCILVTDFVQNFDAISPVGSGVLPDCWSKLGTSLNGNVVAGSFAPMSPINRLYLNVSTTNSVYIGMPQVSNLQMGTHRLRFKAHSTLGGSVLNVGYLSDTADLSTFISLESFILSGPTVSSTAEYTLAPQVLPDGINQLYFAPASGTATTIYIDDVKWEVNSPCVEPTQLTANLITTNSAELSWIMNGATTWEIQYGFKNFVLGTGTTLTATNPYNLTALSPNTIYQYYVRGTCEDAFQSSWAGPFTFKTLCEDSTSIIESFDGLTTNFSTTMPDCWNRSVIGTGTVYVTTGSGAPLSPGNKLYMVGNGALTPPSEAYAILPSLSNLQADTHRLRFKAYSTVANRTIQIGYLTDPNDIYTFVLIEELELPGPLQTSATEFTVIPEGLPEEAKNLVIKNKGFTEIPAGVTTAYFDDFFWEPIPTCVEPSALTVSGITDVSAVLGWIEDDSFTNWEVQYGDVGFTLGTGTIVSASSNPFTLTGLSANTNYIYYVRTICSLTDSSNWSGPIGFQTQCSAVNEFTENFDSIVTNFSTTIMPDCWRRGLIGFPTLHVTNNSIFPMSPANRLYMIANSTAIPSSEAIAIMPPVTNLQASTHRLGFTAFSTANDRYVEIGYLTDLSNLNTYTMIQSIVVPGTVAANAKRFFVSPDALPSGVKNLVFKNPGFPGGASTISIDDVVWEAVPTCLEPFDVTTIGVTGTSATLNWSAATPAPAEGYEYYYSTSILTPSSTPDITVGTLASVVTGITTANLTSLIPSTVYYVWIRSNCSTTNKSEWTLAHTFTTTCTSIIPNYIQDFETFLPNCWEKYATGDITTGPTGPANSGSWVADGFLNVGTTGAAKINIKSTSPIGTGWLVSPVFDLSAGGYQLKFDIGATQFNTSNAIIGEGMGTDDVLNVLMSIDAGVTWTILESFNAENNPPDYLGVTKIYEMPTVTSTTAKFAFYGTSGIFNDITVNADYFVDNFSVQLSDLNTENFDSDNFKYYPNPVTNQLTLSYNNLISEVVVYNLLGQKIMTFYPNAKQTQIDLSGLNAGTYMVRITSDELVKTVKMIKN